MTTLMFVATATVSAIAGAGAMWIPARLERGDAAQDRAAADVTYDKAEALAAEVERTRNLPWYWPTDPDAPAIGAAPAEHEAEVLHVEYPTGELRTVADESEHKPSCPDLYYCPTVGEVESGCHGGFDVCCTAPELHQPVDAEGMARLADEVGLVQALSDRPVEDEDEVGDEQPGETWFDRAKGNFDDVARGVAEAINWPITLVRRAVETWRRWRDERYLIGSGEQAVDPAQPLREVLSASGYTLDPDDEALVELEAWREANPPTNPPYKSHRCPDGGVSGGNPGYRSRHTAKGYETAAWPIVNVPAQRTGDADE